MNYIVFHFLAFPKEVVSNSVAMHIDIRCLCKHIIF